MNRVLLACLAAAVGLTAAPSATAPARSERARIVHALDRLAYGPRPGDVERVQSMGLSRWIEQQLHPERIDDREVEARVARLETVGLDSATLARDYFGPALRERLARQRTAGAAPPDGMVAPDPAGAAGPDGPQAPGVAAAEPGPRSEAQRTAARVLLELNEQRLLRAVASERQLQEVLVDFWFNHFNVHAGKGQTRFYVTEYERQAIRPHVLGRFRDLLEATASSPAMLVYLDNWLSADPKAAEAAAARRARAGARRGRASQGGTGAAQGRDAGPAFPPAGAAGQTAPGASRRRGLNENYARELMELHTLGVDGGYTQQDIVAVARAFTGWTIGPPRDGSGFRFVAALHDASEKVVLGQRIAAGGGIEDGRRVLDILATHPSTARFIATKLARRFVSDDPPTALIDRAARRFADTGGDLREVVRAIVTAPEFFAPEARHAKVKTPLEFVASAVRATGAEVVTALPLARALRDLGMPLYQCQPPTGYDDAGDAWVSSGALVARMNFALDLAAGRLRGVRAPAGLSTPDLDALRATLARDVLHDAASPATLATMARATTPAQAVALAIGAPEFQRQ
jgi:uncharacterized protein (DUF1800 family)